MPRSLASWPSIQRVLSPPEIERSKKAAAEKAVELVEDGMIIGLGSGTTAAYFLRSLATRVAEGLRVAGVPTSNRTAGMAEELGISVTSLEDNSSLDLDVDGADEIDPNLNVLKGGGGALLHEKIVAVASRQFVVIVDESKCVHELCATAAIPVEVVSFGWTATRDRILELHGSPRVRGEANDPYVTDSGNMILDVLPPNDQDIYAFAESLKSVTGVVDHGIFPQLASAAIIGSADGSAHMVLQSLEA